MEAGGAQEQTGVQSDGQASAGWGLRGHPAAQGDWQRAPGSLVSHRVLVGAGAGGEVLAPGHNARASVFGQQQENRPGWCWPLRALRAGALIPCGAGLPRAQGKAWEAFKTTSIHSKPTRWT